jgi:hypothetical protein
MAVFSNYYFFPIAQTVLLATLLWAIFRDVRGKWLRGRGVTVTRGEESMMTLEKITGIVAAGVVTIANKSVFDAEPFWKQYSAFFNVADVCAVLYLCYFSGWGRNLILGWRARSKID